MPQNQAPRGPRQQIQFVSGKGGVGKSLVAAGLAYEQARAGQRVLLAEIGDTSYYKDFFRLESIGQQAVSVPELGFDVALWSGESCLREYVLHYLRVERLYQIFFANKVMRALISVAPGLNEISILGKITSGVRKIGPHLEYDVIVVDCYATGHALALFQAPTGLREAIGFGPMGTQSREIEAVLRNSELCQFSVVTLLEELPVTETLEFRESLRSMLGVDVAIIANKVFPSPVSDKDLRGISSAPDSVLAEFSKFVLSTREAQQKQFEKLKRVAAGGLQQVPLIFSSDSIELVKRVGEALRKP